MKKASYLCIAFCLLAIVGVQAGEQTAFTNSALGFGITKPAHWQVNSADDYFANINQVNLEDKDFKARMLQNAKVPLIAFTKYREPYDDINPSIRVHFKYVGSDVAKDPKHLLDASLLTFKNIFKDFKIIEGPTDADISGIKSAHAKYQYTLTASGGREFPNCSEMWMVPRSGDYIYLIVVGYKQNGSTEDLTAIKNMVSSIKIVPPQASSH